MAAKCPKCGRKLKIYNVKAECPSCGTNIPNYDWEARLEQDNKIAEEKFGKLYATLNMLKYSVAGTKLRIIRIVLSFLPAIGFILPWAVVKSEADFLAFDLLGLFNKGATSTIKFFGIMFKDIGGIVSSITSGTPAAFPLIGFILMLLSVVAIVAAFFLIFIKFRKPKTKAVVVADIISVAFTLAAIVFFSLSSSKVAAGDFTIGTLTFTNATAGVSWGAFVYIVLLCVALVGNILVAKADVKTPEQLEEERLEKVRLKEEKAEQDRVKKEQAKAEAKKKAEQEQAEKVKKAREALASKENKNK